MAALRVERDGDLLRVTLARPERRNAFDAGLIRELTEAFSDVGDARVVVLAGEGESFCAGADVDWQRASIDLTLEENVQDALRLHEMLAALDSCPAPVVARVQGYALGGGSGLVACADVVVAAPDATFGFTEVRLGIIPAVISPFVFARIGPGAARRFFLTGERFDAATAMRIGLVDEVAGRSRRGPWSASSASSSSPGLRRPGRPSGSSASGPSRARSWPESRPASARARRARRACARFSRSAGRTGRPRVSDFQKG